MKKKRQIWLNNDDEGKAFAFSFDSRGMGAAMPPKPPMPPRPPFPPRIFQFGEEFSTSTIYQEVDDDVLEILIALPGIDKKTLKVRSKSTKVSVSADLKEEYKGKLGEEQKNHVIDLYTEVLPDQASAKYLDGVLTLRLPLKEKSKETDVEFEE